MNAFNELGFVPMDLFVLASCIAVSVLAGITDHILRRDDFIQLPEIDPAPLSPKRWAPLLVGRVWISGIAGALLWIVLATGIPATKENYLRLVFLAFIAGAAAPDLALKYRSRLANILGKDFKQP